MSYSELFLFNVYSILVYTLILEIEGRARKRRARRECLVSQKLVGRIKSNVLRYSINILRLRVMREMRSRTQVGVIVLIKNFWEFNILEAISSFGSSLYYPLFVPHQVDLYSPLDSLKGHYLTKSWLVYFL